MKAFITTATPVSDELLNIIAHLPTKSLPAVAESGFFRKLEDRDFMRIAVLLAQKGYDEGGCPIGGVSSTTKAARFWARATTPWCRKTTRIITVKLRLFAMPAGRISAARPSSQRSAPAMRRTDLHAPVS